MTMPPAERQQMARKHIFAVNGSAEFLDFIRELFQEEGYNVTTTNYVPRTFDQVAALQPDMLIVDLAIGVQAGWALLEQLQAEAVTHDIPVIVTTTGGPDLLARAQAQQQRYGGQRFVAKPFDLEELLATVRELIGTAAPEPGSETAS